MSRHHRYESGKDGPKASEPQRSDGSGDANDGDLLAFDGPSRLRASIKVVGVGGGGGNALNNMIRSGLQGGSSSPPTPMPRRSSTTWHR
jgi:cell division GTPase FtsZ